AEALDRWPDATVSARIDRLLEERPIDASPPLAAEAPDGWRWRPASAWRAPRRWVKPAPRGGEPRLRPARTPAPARWPGAGAGRLLEAPELERVRALRAHHPRLELARIDGSAVARGLRELRLRGGLEGGWAELAGFWSRL